MPTLSSWTSLAVALVLCAVAGPLGAVVSATGCSGVNVPASENPADLAITVTSAETELIAGGAPVAINITVHARDGVNCTAIVQDIVIGVQLQYGSGEDDAVRPQSGTASDGLYNETAQTWTLSSLAAGSSESLVLNVVAGSAATPNEKGFALLASVRSVAAGQRLIKQTDDEAHRSFGVRRVCTLSLLIAENTLNIEEDVSEAFSESHEVRTKDILAAADGDERELSGAKTAGAVARFTYSLSNSGPSMCSALVQHLIQKSKDVVMRDMNFSRTVDLLTREKYVARLDPADAISVSFVFATQTHRRAVVSLTAAVDTKTCSRTSTSRATRPCRSRRPSTELKRATTRSPYIGRASYFRLCAHDRLFTGAMSILEYNGGSIVAMVGKDSVAIASDTRFGVGAQTIGHHFSKLFTVQPGVVVGLSGLATDIQTMGDLVQFHINRYTLEQGRAMKTKTVGNLISSILYTRRFGPYFTEPVVCGMQDDEPYICAMDLLGAPVFAKDFVVCGTGGEALYGVAEALWQEDMSREQLFEACSQTLLSALGRDALSGWGAEVHVISSDGVTVRHIKTRQD